MIATVSDQERILLLERRHNDIVRWLELQVEETEKNRKREPHPLDFGLMTDEEEKQVKERALIDKVTTDVTLDTLKEILGIIAGRTKSMEAKLYPCNDFII